MTEKKVDKKVEKFLKKHPPLSDKEVKEKFRESALAKQKYTRDMKEIEKNLLGFLDITEPLIDPSTEKVLAWVKLPTMMKLEEFYTGFSVASPQDFKSMSTAEKLKYQNRQYELMAKILFPKHDAEWWKDHTNLRFVYLFSLKMEQMFEGMGGFVENFPEAT